MSGPDDEREENAEDLFEDLDKFFAPIKDTDWPEGETPAGPGEPETGGAPEGPTPDEDLLAGLTPRIDIPDELTGEPASSAEAGEPGEGPPGERPTHEREGPPEPPQIDEPVLIDDLDEEPAPIDGITDEPVVIEDTGEEPVLIEGAEGSPEDEVEIQVPDIDDLFAEKESAPTGAGEPRDEVGVEAPAGPPVQGEEVEEPVAISDREGELVPGEGDEGSPFGETGEMSGEEWARLRGAAGEEEDEASRAAAAEDISLEDMKVAPPQYTGLPGPDEEEEASLGEVLFPGEGAGAEPDPETVEAAAEHFAEGVREASPEEVERELLSDLEAPGGPASVQIEPEEEAGWTQPVDEEAEATSAPRNLQAAFISGGLLAAAAIALLAIGNGPFAVLAGLVVVLGQGEFYAVMRKRGMQPATALGLAIGALMLGGAYLRGESAVTFGMVLAMGLVVPWYMAAPPEARRGTLRNVAVTLLGVAYVPFLASFALVILRVPGVGRNLLLTVVGLTVLYDICAYGIGTLWGDRRLAPTISPKKSWEGAIGATMVLLVVSLSLVAAVDPFTPATAVGLALVIAFAAPLGDLVESTLKRDLGVKDMGTLLPGHGGVLDRIDSILFAAPAAYYFLLIVL